LFNIEGEIIKSGNIKAPQISLDGILNGIYFIWFQNEKEVSNYLKSVKN